MSLLRIIALIVVLGGVVVATVPNVTSAIHTVPYTIDEVSWYFHTRYFELVAVHPDSRSDKWVSLEAYDHPPFAKYLFGSYLYLLDKDTLYKRQQLENKWGRWAIYASPIFDNQEGFKDFEEPIIHMRQVSGIFLYITAISSGLILFTVTGNIAFALLLSYLLMQNPIVITNLIRATPDAIMTSFILLGILFYLYYYKHFRYHWMVLSAIMSGYAIATKLTAVLLLYGITISELLLYFISDKESSRLLRTLGTLLGIVWAVWFMINPSLYYHPLAGTREYFMFRNEVKNNQMKDFSSVALPSVSSRLHAVYCTVLISGCGSEFSNGELIPWRVVNIVIIIVSIIGIGFALTQNTHRELMLITVVCAGCLILGITLILPLYWDRYLVPVQILVWVLELSGLHWFFAECIRQWRKPHSFLRIGLQKIIRSSTNQKMKRLRIVHVLRQFSVMERIKKPRL